MRFLILSCNTGEGHNSAARAVRDAFNLKNIECDIKDALGFWSPGKSKFISRGHVFIYRRMPKLFGFAYRFEENHPTKEGDDSIIYELVIKGCELLYEFLKENSYDGIICTHVFSAMMVTELKKRHGLNIKSYFVATDYTCTPGVEETKLDTYFIPHKLLIPEFCRSGLEKERMLPYGIPVRQEFFEKISAEKAKEKLGIDKDRKVVLLACGSMGCGPIKSLCDYLPRQLDSNTVLIVICGNNRRLYRTLTKYPLPDNMRVLGYTKKMSLYMDAAELILTKPGGLSTTEASVKALPMIFIDAVPGCETRNSDFFVLNNFADLRNSALELCDLVCDYIENPNLLAEKREILSSQFSRNAAKVICDYVLEELSV